ncbi:hypothetical protein KFU94_68725 [Chloroflexi bacterium TSY]|nr:hypothetical protein [Chloroflexi bacterium TSY]
MQLNNVNTTDILDAIRLGCRTMCSVFNADDNHIPFFGSRVRPNAELSFSWAHSESHVPGRHLNALLNAEAAAGITLDEECIDHHARAAFFSYGGAVPLPLNRAAVDGPLVNFLPHNVREGFHALYALAHFRQSEKAYDLAQASIAAILERWDPVKGWDYEYLEGESGLTVQRSTFIVGLARAIGPLVKLYRTTRCASALELAIILAQKATNEFFTAGGGYDRETFGTHTHSTTCVMSSLAQLAELTSDAHLMERVRAFYDNGLWQIRDELGWVIESSADEADPDRGEVNNTGDIVETALLLGRWGYPEYYQDAERILRGHMLPSQLRDVSFIQEPSNSNAEDGKRDVAQRHLGAFGFPAPYGHEPLEAESISFNMDIVGGAVGSLCAVYREIAHSDRAGHWVHLLFDHETAAVRVESPYTHPCLRVRVKRPGPLFVRIPSWVMNDEIQIGGSDAAPHFVKGYLCLAKPRLNRWIEIDFPLTEQEISLKHRTRDIAVRLRGDEVTAMQNLDADLTFFASTATMSENETMNESRS